MRRHRAWKEDVHHRELGLGRNGLRLAYIQLSIAQRQIHLHFLVAPRRADNPAQIGQRAVGLIARKDPDAVDPQQATGSPGIQKDRARVLELPIHVAVSARRTDGPRGDYDNL